jgi:hypothetical protein
MEIRIERVDIRIPDSIVETVFEGFGRLENLRARLDSLGSRERQGLFVTLLPEALKILRDALATAMANTTKSPSTKDGEEATEPPDGQES